MFSLFRGRLTWVNVAMTLALVFAMAGGAYAAKRYVISNIKQISPRVVKQLAGRTGPAGPEGKQGPVGPEGKAGANGKDGTNGKDGLPGEPGKNGTDGEPGESVISKEFSGAKGPTCTVGGSEFEVEGSVTYACNGTNGSGGGGGGGTLKSGETETGSWYVERDTAAEAVGGTVVEPQEHEVTRTPITFACPLAEPTAPQVTPKFEYVTEGTTSGCKGSVNAPTAEPGFFCVYSFHTFERHVGGASLLNVETFDSAHVSRFGTILQVESSAAGPLIALGSWAVTAE